MTWSRQSLAAAFPVAAVAAIAAVVSYGHIESLALAQHQSVAAARLLPFAVDFLIVAGSVILLAGSRLGWLCVVCGVAATLFANVESGVAYGPLAATVAAWPAVAFTVASFTLERWLRRQARQAAPEPAAVPQKAFAVPPAPLAEPSPEPAGPQESKEAAGGSQEARARARYLESAAGGKPLTDRALAMEFGRSRTWGASRIRETRAA